MSTTKHFAGRSVMSAMLAGLAACSAPPEQSAIETAEEWLALVDEGDFAQSWHDLAPQRRLNVTEEAWVAQLEQKRLELGKNIGRTFQIEAERRATDRDEGYPYRMSTINYSASFERGLSTTETIDLRTDQEGRWAVSDYIIWPSDTLPDYSEP